MRKRAWPDIGAVFVAAELFEQMAAADEEGSRSFVWGYAGYCWADTEWQYATRWRVLAKSGWKEFEWTADGIKEAIQLLQS